jgi:hypothetical protein
MSTGFRPSAFIAKPPQEFAQENPQGTHAARQTLRRLIVVISVCKPGSGWCESVTLGTAKPISVNHLPRMKKNVQLQ